jgi:hypothetical protein
MSKVSSSLPQMMMINCQSRCLGVHSACGFSHASVATAWAVFINNVRGTRQAKVDAYLDSSLSWMTCCPLKTQRNLYILFRMVNTAESGVQYHAMNRVEERVVFRDVLFAQARVSVTCQLRAKPPILVSDQISGTKSFFLLHAQ